MRAADAIARDGPRRAHACAITAPALLVDPRPAQQARLVCIAFVAFFLLSQRGMTRLRATWPVLLIAAFLATGTAAAQVKTADLANATLEELMNIPVTTATRASETLANAPARMQVITEEQIRTRGYRSLMELLEDLPDFKVDLAGDQDYPTELTVQGTRGASRVIVLLDGIRVSSPTNEPLPILANYPVHAAKQVEIVYGPASAVYGADAFSGVVNIISRNGKESPGLTVSTAGGQHGLYNQSASYGTRLGKNGSLLMGGQFYYDRQPDLSEIYPRDFNGLQGQQTGTFNTIFGPMQSPLPVSRDYEVPISAWSFQTLFEHGGTQLSLFANNARVPTSPAYTPDNAVYNDAAFNDNDLLVVSGSHTRNDSSRRDHVHGHVQPSRARSAIRLLERLQQHDEELQVRVRLDAEVRRATRLEAGAQDDARGAARRSSDSSPSHRAPT